ncbi:MAG TPA: sulfite exporter TauE/SafE family protein [Acidimicrobiia bacterium]
MDLVLIAAIGAAVGFLGGLFGKGGSAIATPLLGVVGVPPIAAVASPLPSTIPGTLVAAYAYWEERLVDWRIVRWSVPIGVPATIAGAYSTRWIGGSFLVVVTEIVVAALGARVLLHPADPHEQVAVPRALRTRMALVALVVGLLSGLLANGGGFLLAPLYVVVLRVPIKAAFASSLVVAAALAVPGTIVHAVLGHIDWGIVAVFAATAIPLSYVGGRVAVRTQSTRLERVYGAGLVLIGLGTLAAGL